MQLCYFTSAKHLLENLQKKRLKISRFSDCNDEFELGNFRAHRDQSKCQSKKDREEIREWVRKQNDSFGLICFSRHHYSPLMWAHYADRNRGVCLVFATKGDLFKSCDCKLLPVNYTRNRSTLPEKLRPIDLSKLPDEEQIRLAATKELDWSYEEEMRLLIDISEDKPSFDAHTDRIIVKKDGHHFFNFDGYLKLTKVYLGPRTSICADAVNEVLTESGYGSDEKFVQQKRAAFSDFRIVDQKNKGLWKKCTNCECRKKSRGVQE
ncbi:DUF2971 domain-containing protein [Phaeobacter sp. CNT1-3]|nr:DUF2971 domain-containing protein [Phaeobacter sp. CNT1-3]